MSLTEDRGWMATAKLLHYGVKGMRWGVRKDRGAPTSVVVREGGFKGKKLKTKGGENRPTSQDAARAATIGQVRRKSGARALSNEELSAYNQRLNLEAQAQRLNYEQSNAGKKFVLSLIGQTGKTTAQSAANQVAAHQVKKSLIKKGLIAGAAAAV